jgi:hypothetical protein
VAELMGLDPILATLTVPATPDLAFEVFTLGMGGWWDPVYSPDEAGYEGIAISPEVGSPVAIVAGGESYPIGSVTVWEPGRRYAQTFSLAMDPAHPSTIEARFTADDSTAGAGTRVEFEHGGWTPDNESFRHKYGDWPHLLGRYAGAVSGPGGGG